MYVVAYEAHPDHGLALRTRLAGADIRGGIASVVS
jgi:hypothetical protein